MKLDPKKRLELLTQAIASLNLKNIMLGKKTKKSSTTESLMMKL